MVDLIMPCHVTNAALQIMPEKPARGTRPMVAKSVRDALALQQLLIEDAKNPKTTPVARAALARAWSCLQTSIREMRGIPLPGQLQPSLGQTMKRARRGPSSTLDLPANGFKEAIAATEQPSPAAAQPPKPPVAESTRPTTGEGKPADQDKTTPESS